MDTSREMGEMARRLRQMGESEGEREGEEEVIRGVYFRQYLPTSDRVCVCVYVCVCVVM